MAQNEGPTILIVMWTTTLIATLIVAARLFTRLKIVRNIGLDDYLITSSMVGTPWIRCSCYRKLMLLGDWSAVCQSCNSCCQGRRWPACPYIVNSWIRKSRHAKHCRIHSWDRVLCSAEARGSCTVVSDLQPHPALQNISLDVHRWRRFSYLRVYHHPLGAM